MALARPLRRSRLGLRMKANCPGSEDGGAVEHLAGGVGVPRGPGTVEFDDCEGVLEDGAHEEDAPATRDVEGHVDRREVDECVDAPDVRFCAAEFGRVRGMRHDGETVARGEVGLDLGGVAVMYLAARDGHGRVVVKVNARDAGGAALCVLGPELCDVNVEEVDGADEVRG